MSTRKAAPAAAAAAVALATAAPKLNRYAVRRQTADVWVWTDELGKRKDIEEVWAPNPQAALAIDNMPDPRNISLDQLERMGKEQLIIFGKVKLGVTLDGGKKKSELLDEVKMAIFMRPASPDIEEVAVDMRSDAGAAKGQTKPLAPNQVRTNPGV